MEFLSLNMMVELLDPFSSTMQFFLCYKASCSKHMFSYWNLYNALFCKTDNRALMWKNVSIMMNHSYTSLNSQIHRTYTFHVSGMRFLNDPPISADFDIPKKNYKKNIVKFYSRMQFKTSAVYTGIKKPESFSHSGFSLKVARQLPPKHSKKTESKNHLRSVIFWNSAEISLVFCQCKRSLNLAGIFGFLVTCTWPSAESPDAARDVMRTTRVRSKVERSRACAPLTKTQVWDSGFSRMRFSCQKPRMLWVFLAV